MRRNEVTFQKNAFYSKARQDAMAHSKRRRLILGRTVNQYQGVRQLGSLRYHIPSPFSSHTECGYIKGPAGSGKTWVAFSLAMQSFFAEGRTWIIIDTKNSVTWNTKIYARINGIEQHISIGKFIDSFLPSQSISSQEKILENTMYEILSLDKNHKVSWTPIHAISKHKSPEKIIKITTRSGRVIESTEGHSFVTLNNGKYQSIKGSDLKCGSYIPIAKEIKCGNIDTLHVLDYFKNDEILDFDKIKNTIAICDKDNNCSPISIYNASGLQTISYGGFMRYLWGEREIPKGHFKCISKNHSKSNPFPKEIPLTEEFGYVCGMFIAEGYAINKKGMRHVDITNYDYTTIQKVKMWLNKYNIPFSSSKKRISIHCLPLTTLFTRLFGDGITTNSHTKTLPNIFFNANKKFIKGVLDGYMSGDGTIRKPPRNGISFVTASKQLREDLSILFKKFGIHIRYSSDNRNNRMIYKGSLSTSDILKFKHIGFTHPKKQKRLFECLENGIVGYDSKHLIDIDYIFDGLSYRKERKTIKNIIKKKKDFCSITNAKHVYEDLVKSNYMDRAKKLKGLIDGDVWWDKIEKIEYLDPTSHFVYDLSILKNENFMLSNNCIVHNSHRGNWRANMDFYDEIKKFGAVPRGIPETQIDVISPKYYIDMKLQNDKKAVQETGITHPYRIPLRLCSLQIMFELTKMNRKAGYAATFDRTFKKILSSKKTPRISDLIAEFKNIAKDPDLKIVKNVFKMMLKKIQQFGKQMIKDGAEWSSLGECLFRAAQERKPRWIVFTLSLGDRPEDDTNLAMITAVLTELKLFAEYARAHNLPVQLGLLLDELHAFTRNKDASARMAIHDLIYLWGRTAKIFRLMLTQRDEQVDKVFRDAIHPIKRSGVYQVLAECRAIPTPGHLSYLNRVSPSDYDPDQPTYYANVVSMPPWAEVESDELDDTKWINRQRDKFMQEQRRQKQHNRGFAPDPRTQFSVNDLRSF